MDYVYDIVLNFQNEYYEFYEWQKEDKIINLKKVPIYKISTKDYLNIKNNEVTLDKIPNIGKNRILLLTNSSEVMGIMINTSGKVIKKSSLIFEEADDILVDKNHIKYLNIKYHIDKINKTNYFSRIKKEKIKYIDNYLKKIDIIKDEYLIKYIYYEIYLEEEKDPQKAYNKLLELSQKNIDKLYDAINNVNAEIKNPFN